MRIKLRPPEGSRPEPEIELWLEESKAVPGVFKLWAKATGEEKDFLAEFTRDSAVMAPISKERRPILSEYFKNWGES